jgi:hypothetical protein
MDQGRYCGTCKQRLGKAEIQRRTKEGQIRISIGKFREGQSRCLPCGHFPVPPARKTGFPQGMGKIV